MEKPNLLKEMNRSRKLPVVIFQDFALNYSRNKDVIFCFFEGKDDYKYYFSRIKKYTKKELLKFDCDCKHNIFEVHRKLEQNYKDKCIMLFFVDRDFDEKCNCDSIYETPTYSIENFYISDNVFKEILKAEFSLTENCSSRNIAHDFRVCMCLYQLQKSDLISELLLLNAWYSLQKIKSKDFKIMPKLSKLKELKSINIKIGIDTISSNYNLQFLKDNTENFIEVSQEEIDREIERLQKEPEKHIRGKYLTEFLLKFILLLLEDVNKHCRYFSYKRKVSFNVSKNIISELSQYAETPACLDHYLMKYIGVINKQNLHVS